MGEYISREDVCLQLLKQESIDGQPRAIRRARRIVANCPAADVVEVVRCGECANWQSGWKPSAAKDGTHFCANVGLCTPSDWYCADGERKDGEWHDHYQIDSEYYVVTCSVCGCTSSFTDAWLPSYCPNCGAEMKGAREDT